MGGESPSDGMYSREDIEREKSGSGCLSRFSQLSSCFCFPGWVDVCVRVIDSYVLPVSAGSRIQEVPTYPLVSHGKLEKENSNSVLGENSKSASSSIRTSSSSTGRPSSVRFSSMLQNNVRIGSSR